MSEIKPLSSEHARQVAALHIEGINTGFISSLGIEFVTALYEAISQSPYAFGFVEVEGEQVLGFVSFTTNLKGLYKSVCKRKGFRFALLLVSKMFSFQKIKKIFETLFYPSRIQGMELPDAELLSIAVSSNARGQGVAGKLVRAGYAECAKREIEKVKVLVAQSNEPANKLYQKNGFELVQQIENHGVISNIYIASTTID